MKKSLTFILSAIMLISIIPGKVLKSRVYAKEDENVAVAVLGKQLQKSGFSTVEMGETAGDSIDKRENEYGWLLNHKLGRNKAFINFAVDEKFKPKEFDGTEYELYIEYFDEGQGFFKIEYDAVEKADKKAGLITTSNQKQWKSVAFTLTDARFQNRLGGKYDFRLKIVDAVSSSNKASSSSVLVKKVELRKKPQKNPIRATAVIDEVGNGFGWDEENKIIHTRLENLTDKKQTVSVEYKLVSRTGREFFKKTEELTFEPREVKNVEVNAGEVRWCDRYEYHVAVKNETIDSDVRVANLSIMKTDSNGILNDEQYMCVKPSHNYPDKSYFDDAVRMTKKLNAGGIRTEIPWWDVQRQTPVPWEQTTSAYSANAVKEQGLDLMALLCAAGWQMSHYSEYPRTPDKLELFRDYVKTAAENLSKLGFHSYEIWNEGNAGKMNWNHEGGGAYGGVLYANMFKLASDTIKSVDPEAKVLGPTAAGNLDRADAGNHFREAMEAGFWKNDPVLSLHMYPASRPEYTWVESDVERYQESFREKGVDDIEIWHTETGYTRAESFIKGDEWKQGAYITRMLLMHKANRSGDKTFIHNLQRNGEIPFDREDMFGIVGPFEAGANPDEIIYDAEYPALVVTAYNYVLANSETVEKIDTGEKEVIVTRFKSDKFNSDIVSMHTYSDNERQITLDLGTDKVTFFDTLGNETEVFGVDGVFTFMADGSPVYAMGDFEKVELIKEETPIKLTKKYVNATEGDTIECVFENNTGDNISLEVVNLPEALEVLPVENTSETLKIKNNMKNGDKSEFTILVKQGDKVIASEDIKLSCTNTINRSIFTNVSNPEDLNKWRADFELKNNSFTKTAEGYIEFKKPDFLKGMKKIDIGRIPANCTGLVSVQLPDILKKSQYTVEYDFIYKDGSRETYIDKIDFTAAPYMTKSPTIDGVHEAGEWNKTGAMYVESDDQVKQMTDWGGKEDLSGYVTMQWDEENLYLAAEITDDNYFFAEADTANIWKDDSIQFGVYYGVVKDTTQGQATTTFHEIGMGTTTDGAKVHRWSSQDNTVEVGTCMTAEVAVKRVDNKTFYEFKMPWKDILRPQDEAPKGGETLGFSFLVNDNDGSGRRGWIEYASGIGESKNTALFTYLTLIK